jgi:hypothetical protein
LKKSVPAKVPYDIYQQSATKILIFVHSCCYFLVVFQSAYDSVHSKMWDLCYGISNLFWCAKDCTTVPCHSIRRSCVTEGSKHKV